MIEGGVDDRVQIVIGHDAHELGPDVLPRDQVVGVARLVRGATE